MSDVVERMFTPKVCWWIFVGSDFQIPTRNRHGGATFQVAQKIVPLDKSISRQPIEIFFKISSFIMERLSNSPENFAEIFSLLQKLQLLCV